MVKVKNNIKKREHISKTRKKSLSSHLIKSTRKKSIPTALSTPKSKNKLKRKNSDTEFTITKIDEINPLREKATLQKKEKSTKKLAIDTNIKNENIESTDLSQQYNINSKDVESAIRGVLKLHSENPKIKNQLFDNDTFPISLMINCHKIPRGHQTILRIPLKHSLLTPDDEVCLIVSEVKGIGNKEHEKHIEHYENLLSKKGVTNINKILTVHELKTEYETFEQKSRLVDLYDAFLVCGKVSGKVVKKCGKIFYTKRKVPTSVKLQSTNLKDHIDKQLSKAFLHLHLKGDCYNVIFGHNQMKVPEIMENFQSVVDFLDKQFPGGFENIKGLHVSAPRATSIPVYISIKNPKDVPKVKVQNSNRKFKSKSVKGELTTLPNAEVLVKPDGQVIVKRLKRKLDDEDIEDDLQVL